MGLGRSKSFLSEFFTVTRLSVDTLEINAGRIKKWRSHRRHEAEMDLGKDVFNNEGKGKKKVFFMRAEILHTGSEKVLADFIAGPNLMGCSWRL